MGALVGGIIALVLGLLGLIIWWDHLIQFLLAIIPIGLILGGALATYLGIEEWKDTASRTESLSSFDSSPATPVTEPEERKVEAEPSPVEPEGEQTETEGEKKEEA